MNPQLTTGFGISGSRAWSTPCRDASPKPKPHRSRISSFSNYSSRTSSRAVPIASLPAGSCAISASAG